MSTHRAEARAPSFDGEPDSTLIELTLSGETAAFEAIMRRNNRRLFRIARGILGVDADAEDAVQECYVNTYLKWKNAWSPRSARLSFSSGPAATAWWRG